MLVNNKLYQTLTIAFVALITPSVFSQNNPVTNLETQKITVYNNGIYHIIKSGSVEFTNNYNRLPIYNAPLFGSYWAFSNKAFELQMGNDTIKVKREANDYVQLIQNNLNVNLELEYLEAKSSTKILGKFIYFNKNSGLSKFQTKDQQEFYLNLDNLNITQLRFLDKESIDLKVDSVFQTIGIHSKTNQQNIELHYMAQGINWVPSYYIRLDSDKSAKFDMKAVVENFGESFKDTELELVLGPVNMHYGNKQDPFANMNYSSVSNNNNYPYAQVSRSANSYKMAAESLERDDYATAGAKNENLYHYQLGRKTIDKNSKTYIQIFSTEVKYKKEYHVDFPNIFNFNQNTTKNLAKTEGNVNNYLIFKNTTNYPIANGAVFLESGAKRFISQEELNYTPVNGEVWIHIGKVLDFETENNETEKSRNTAQKTFNKRNYYKVIVEGELIVKNLTNVTTATVVTKNFNGAYLKSDGLIPSETNVIGNAYNLNPSTKLTYNVSLKPNERKTITYEYEIWLGY